MTSRGPKTEDHSVLVREVVRDDGSHVTALRVFCSRQEKSVPFGRCEACPSCVAITVDADGVPTRVSCAPSLRPTPPPKDDDLPGEGTPVGTVLRGSTLCIEEDARLRAVHSLLAGKKLPVVCVVDDEGRLVGLVRDVNVPADPKTSLLDSVMSTSTGFREEESVRDAIRKMASSHLREIPIVTRSGQLLGVLRDVDGLNWIAAEKKKLF